MRYTTITSPSNPHVKQTLSLKEKRRKDGSTSFLIEGTHVIETALQSQTALGETFFTEGFATDKNNLHLLRLLSKRGVQLFQVSEKVLSRLAETETPQGIVAVASYRTHALDGLPLSDNPLLVIIDGIQDPGNLGTIIRTSDAAGADAVIVLPGTCDAFLPKVVRSTAGSIFTVPLAYTDEDALVAWLKGRGIILAVTDIRSRKTVYEEDLSRPLALVFGNEARGVRESLRQKADVLVRVPIPGKAESLNVAVSAAVCLYEAVRQRSRPA